jgi:hypothetical protein
MKSMQKAMRLEVGSAGPWQGGVEGVIGHFRRGLQQAQFVIFRLGQC